MSVGRIRYCMFLSLLSKGNGLYLLFVGRELCVCECEGSGGFGRVWEVGDISLFVGGGGVGVVGRDLCVCECGGCGSWGLGRVWEVGNRSLFVGGGGVGGVGIGGVFVSVRKVVSFVCIM